MDRLEELRFRVRKEVQNLTSDSAVHNGDTPFSFDDVPRNMRKISQSNRTTESYLKLMDNRSSRNDGSRKCGDRSSYSSHRSVGNIYWNGKMQYGADRQNEHYSSSLNSSPTNYASPEFYSRLPNTDYEIDQCAASVVNQLDRLKRPVGYLEANVREEWRKGRNAASNGREIYVEEQDIDGRRGSMDTSTDHGSDKDVRTRKVRESNYRSRTTKEGEPQQIYDVLSGSHKNNGILGKDEEERNALVHLRGREMDRTRNDNFDNLKVLTSSLTGVYEPSFSQSDRKKRDSLSTDNVPYAHHGLYSYDSEHQPAVQQPLPHNAASPPAQFISQYVPCTVSAVTPKGQISMGGSRSLYPTMLPSDQYPKSSVPTSSSSVYYTPSLTPSMSTYYDDEDMQNQREKLFIEKKRKQYLMAVMQRETDLLEKENMSITDKLRTFRSRTESNTLDYDAPQSPITEYSGIYRNSDISADMGLNKIDLGGRNKNENTIGCSVSDPNMTRESVIAAMDLAHERDILSMRHEMERLKHLNALEEFKEELIERKHKKQEDSRQQIFVKKQKEQLLKIQSHQLAVTEKNLFRQFVKDNMPDSTPSIFYLENENNEIVIDAIKFKKNSNRTNGDQTKIQIKNKSKNRYDNYYDDNSHPVGVTNHNSHFDNMEESPGEADKETNSKSEKNFGKNIEKRIGQDDINANDIRKRNRRSEISDEGDDDRTDNTDIPTKISLITVSNRIPPDLPISVQQPCTGFQRRRDQVKNASHTEENSIECAKREEKNTNNERKDVIPANQDYTEVENNDGDIEAGEKREDENEKSEREVRLQSIEDRMSAERKKNSEDKKAKLERVHLSNLSEQNQESTGPRSHSFQTEISGKLGAKDNIGDDGEILNLADRRENVEKEMKVRSGSQNKSQLIFMDPGSLIPIPQDALHEFSAASTRKKSEELQQYLNKSVDPGSVDSARTNVRSDVLDFNNQISARISDFEKIKKIGETEETSNSSEKIIRGTTVTPLELKSQNSDRDNSVLQSSSRSTSSFKRRLLSRSESNLKIELDSEVESRVSVRSISRAKSANPLFPFNRAVSMPFEAWKQGPKTVPTDPYIPNRNESLEIVIVKAINLPENCTVSRYNSAVALFLTD